MIIKMIPQVRDYDKIWYEIEEDKITIEIDGVSETFDFTGLPDGELDLFDVDDGKPKFETKLKEIPIISAEKKDGELMVEIIFSIDADEMDERLLFPEPMTLDEFHSLMDELKEREVEEDAD